MNLLGALAKLGSLTMAPRIFGSACDMIIARMFGAGDVTDTLLTTFKLPNLLRRILAEGVFPQTFVPALVEHRQMKPSEATWELVQYVTGMLTFALTVVTVIGVLAASWITRATATGFGKNLDELVLAADLLRIIFPYTPLIPLSSSVGSILNTYHKFQIPAFTPVLLNISSIVTALFFVPYFDPPIAASVRTVSIGGVLQLVFQLPWLAKQGLLKLSKLDFHNSVVNRIIKLMIPSIFVANVAQVSLVISTIFVSYLQSGNITWMYYAGRMTELPVGVLGVALGTILLPTLSKHVDGRNPEESSKLLDWGLRLCFLLAAPATMALAALSLLPISTLFMSKGFTYHDAITTRNALAVCPFCMVGQITVKVLTPAFCMQQNIRMPVKIAVLTLVVTQPVNLVFVGPLKHVDLSFSVGLGVCLNVGLLFTLLHRHGTYLPGEGWRPFSAKLLAALAVMDDDLLAAQYWPPMDWQHAGGLRKVGQLFVLIFIGGGLHFASPVASGFRLHHFRCSETK